MLNPLASEFKPGQSDPKQPVSEQKPAPGNQPNERKKHSNRNKATRDQKFKDRSTESKAGPPPPSSSSSNKNKGNDVGSKSAEKKQQQPSSSNSRNKQQQLGGGGRRRSSRASISQAQNETALFEEPLKFITIPEAIEPVFRTRPDIVERSSAGGGKSDHGRRKSGGGVATTTTSKIVHAYERYIEWFGRCLKTFDRITIVGMDQAIADVVSLVTILQHRGIGEHDEVETFTVEQGGRRYTSCIQVKLHRI